MHIHTSSILPRYREINQVYIVSMSEITDRRLSSYSLFLSRTFVARPLHANIFDISKRCRKKKKKKKRKRKIREIGPKCYPVGISTVRRYILDRRVQSAAYLRRIDLPRSRRTKYKCFSEVCIYFLRALESCAPSINPLSVVRFSLNAVLFNFNYDTA